MIKLLEKYGFVPRVAVWELTLRCNLGCLHCGSRAGKARPDELTLGEALKLCDNLAEARLSFRHARRWGAALAPRLAADRPAARRARHHRRNDLERPGLHRPSRPHRKDRGPRDDRVQLGRVRSEPRVPPTLQRFVRQGARRRRHREEARAHGQHHHDRLQEEPGRARSAAVPPGGARRPALASAARHAHRQPERPPGAGVGPRRSTGPRAAHCGDVQRRQYPSGLPRARRRLLRRARGPAPRPQGLHPLLDRLPGRLLDHRHREQRQHQGLPVAALGRERRGCVRRGQHPEPVAARDSGRARAPLHTTASSPSSSWAGSVAAATTRRCAAGAALGRASPRAGCSRTTPTVTIDSFRLAARARARCACR